MTVITWLKWRRPGNRVVKYFVRALNRLGCEYDLQLAPVYISARNNRLQDEFPMLNITDAKWLGVSKGYTSADVDEIAMTYFSWGLQSFDAFLPNDHCEHVAAGMQYVEKRTVGSIRQEMCERVYGIVLGYGANARRPIVEHEQVAAAQWVVTPWPSELQLLQESHPAT